MAIHPNRRYQNVGPVPLNQKIDAANKRLRRFVKVLEPLLVTDDMPIEPPEPILAPKPEPMFKPVPKPKPKKEVKPVADIMDNPPSEEEFIKFFKEGVEGFREGKYVKGMTTEVEGVYPNLLFLIKQTDNKTYVRHITNTACVSGLSVGDVAAHDVKFIGVCAPRKVNYHVAKTFIRWLTCESPWAKYIVHYGVNTSTKYGFLVRGDTPVNIVNCITPLMRTLTEHYVAGEVFHKLCKSGVKGHVAITVAYMCDETFTLRGNARNHCMNIGNFGYGALTKHTTNYLLNNVSEVGAPYNKSGLMGSSNALYSCNLDYKGIILSKKVYQLVSRVKPVELGERDHFNPFRNVEKVMDYDDEATLKLLVGACKEIELFMEMIKDV